MTPDEQFANELLSNLITRAETFNQTLARLPQDVTYPSRARSILIRFLKELNAAITQRLHNLRTGPPQPSYTTIEIPAKRLGQVLDLLFLVFEFIVHSEAHRIPSPLIAPFEAMARRFFPDALLLVRYLWQYNFHYDNTGDFFKSWCKYSGLNLPTPPPDHFVVIGFPTTERENVLLHCVFAHELGHFLAKAKLLENLIPVTIDPGLFQAVPAPKKTQLLDVILQWYREIFSDVFGIYLLGPACFLAFSEIGLQALDIPSASHPPPHLRLTWMLTLHRRLGYLDQKDQSGASTVAGSLDDKSKAHLEKWDAFLKANPLAQLDPFYACVINSVGAAMDRIEQEVKRVVGTNGFTARRFADEVNHLVERILRLVPPSEADALPNPSFESILNAGWVVRTTRLDDLYDVLSASKSEEKAEALKILNGLLFKALEFLIVKTVWAKTT